MGRHGSIEGGFLDWARATQLSIENQSGYLGFFAQRDLERQTERTEEIGRDGFGSQPSASA